MKTFAMMTGNTVANIITADNKEETEAALKCVLIEFNSDNPAGIDYTYDFESKRFLPPPVITDEAVPELSLDDIETQTN